MRTRNLWPLALGAGLALVGAGQASAATLCVNPAGTGGCHASISAAVTGATSGDTIMVAAGTYKEDVVIPKSIYLVGADAATTVIEAAGNSNGVYVDGIDWPHLARVGITGFTIRDAKFEGILVTNASDVTILGNRVVHNDRALVITNGDGACSGLPAFETNEGDDCGEGVHLMGVDHSIVASNIVHGNAGGVLLSDDTGPTSYNQVTNNIISDNLSDCGITMASHAAATFTGASKPFGVFRNKALGNISTGNGTQAPGGAGAGIFASIPGAAAYENEIGHNKLTGNGMTGVAMHSHAPGQNLTNNAILGNTISGNGPDTGDATTSGPTGINLYAVSPATGTVITGNVISGESIDIAVKTQAIVAVHLNDLAPTATGVQNLGSGLVDATLNWWGCAAGPGNEGCSTASGSKLLTWPPLMTAP